MQFCFQDATDDDTPPQEVVLQVEVHTVTINPEPAIVPSETPSKMRKRVRNLLAEQQQNDSPDIQVVPWVSPSL